MISRSADIALKICVVRCPPFRNLDFGVLTGTTARLFLGFPTRKISGRLLTTAIISVLRSVSNYALCDSSTGILQASLIVSHHERPEARCMYLCE